MNPLSDYGKHAPKLGGWVNNHQIQDQVFTFYQTEKLTDYQTLLPVKNQMGEGKYTTICVEAESKHMIC